MSVETKQGGLRFGHVRLKDFGSAVTIKISARRFCEIHNRTAGQITHVTPKEKSSSDRVYLAELFHFLSNTLMPDLMDKVLKEVLTPNQYELISQAIREGKPVALRPTKRVGFIKD